MPLSSVVGAQSIVKPGVCTSSTRPASPYDGQMIYETDTDAVKVWDGSAWVGATNTASLNGIGESVAYTPTWTALTVGNGVQDFTYVRINKFVHVEGTLILGSTSSVSTTPKMSLPVTAASANLMRGICVGRRVGVGFYYLAATYASTTQTALYSIGTSGASANATVVDATTPFTWSTGDVFHISLSYEAA